jgi:hypothetical protein
MTLNAPIYIVGKFCDTQEEFRSMYLANVVRNINYKSALMRYFGVAATPIAASIYVTKDYKNANCSP